MHPLTCNELCAQADTVSVDRLVQVIASAMGADNRYCLKGAPARPDFLNLILLPFLVATSLVILLLAQGSANDSNNCTK